MKFRHGIFHCHSGFSYDCSLTLNDYRPWAKSLDFDFVLLAEHSRGKTNEAYQEYRRDCLSASDDRVTFIPGLEYESADRYELIALNASEIPDQSLSFGDAVTFFSERANLLVLPHPRADWFQDENVGLKPFLEAVHGLEIANVKRSSKYFPTASFLTVYNALQGSFPHLIGMAGLDLHEPSGICPALITMKHTASSLEELFRQMRNGEFVNTLPFHRFGSKGPYPIDLLVRHGGPILRWACNSALAKNKWVSGPAKRMLGMARTMCHGVR